jgi:hypothetical protein
MEIILMSPFQRFFIIYVIQWGSKLSDYLAEKVCILYSILRVRGEYNKIYKRVQNEAIILLVHGNTNDFREVHPHGYV